MNLDVYLQVAWKQWLSCTIPILSFDLDFLPIGNSLVISMLFNKDDWQQEYESRFVQVVSKKKKKRSPKVLECIPFLVLSSSITDRNCWNP